MCNVPLKEQLKNFTELTRAYSLLMTFATLIIIFSFASSNRFFSILNFILLAVALCCLHLGGNLFDDYIDVKRKLKEAGDIKNIFFSSFVPKARLIKDGIYSLKQVEMILSFLFIIPVLIGIYFTIFAGYYVLLYALVGAALILFYPVSSKFYLAEIIIGLLFGPIAIMGGYYALVGDFHSGLLVESIAFFFAVIVLLHAHSTMDWEFDIKEGKKTLAILTGSKKNSIRALKWIIAFSYAVVIFGVIIFRILNPYTLYVFLTLPIAVELLKTMDDFINIRDVQFKPRWYYGFFENWEQIKENHLEFFMYRFYLARNFGFFFALFLVLGAISG